MNQAFITWCLSRRGCCRRWRGAWRPPSTAAPSPGPGRDRWASGQPRGEQSPGADMSDVMIMMTPMLWPTCLWVPSMPALSILPAEPQSVQNISLGREALIIIMCTPESGASREISWWHIGHNFLTLNWDIKLGDPYNIFSPLPEGRMFWQNKNIIFPMFGKLGE